MVVSYVQTLSADMIAAEIESLLDWHNQILRQCFFPGSQSRQAESSAPAALLMWCRRECEKQGVDGKVSARLEIAYNDLCAGSRKLLDYCAQGAVPTLETYDAFEQVFEGYITHIRRLQQDITATEVSIDTVTGLRTATGLRMELKREQDRFDRKGASFSVAAIEIDNLPALQQQYDRRAQDAIYAAVGHLIAGTIRSFDDAYYMGKGEYLIVLKHVDFMDACSVMDRMRAQIEVTPVALPSGEQLNITVSLGIAEAVQREAPDKVVEYSKRALCDAQQNGGNSVGEFREVSPLGQMARNFND